MLIEAVGISLGLALKIMSIDFITIEDVSKLSTCDNKHFMRDECIVLRTELSINLKTTSITF